MLKTGAFIPLRSGQPLSIQLPQPRKAFAPRVLQSADHPNAVCNAARLRRRKSGKG
jgi:hypothetical protein